MSEQETAHAVELPLLPPPPTNGTTKKSSWSNDAAGSSGTKPATTAAAAVTKPQRIMSRKYCFMVLAMLLVLYNMVSEMGKMGEVAKTLLPTNFYYNIDTIDINININNNSTTTTTTTIMIGGGGTTTNNGTNNSNNISNTTTTVTNNNHIAESAGQAANSILSWLGDAVATAKESAATSMRTASEALLRDTNNNGNTHNHQQQQPKRRIQFDPVAQQIRQSQARWSLKRMEERKVFQTHPFTTRETVLEKGFQRTWLPCTLERILQAQSQQSPKLEVVLVGGSSSSRPGSGDECKIASHDSKGGRYSNQLHVKLEQEELALNSSSSSTASGTIPSRSPPIHFEIINRAQGASCSVTNALMMDELINPHTTDIIIWEFFINDHHGERTERIRKLDFWLTRVKALYEQAGKRPPAILLNYLWTYGAGTGKYLKYHDAVNNDALKEVGPLIDAYRALGWDIAVVNVGAVANSKIVMYQPKSLFDDMHHPSCGGSFLISDMLQYALTSNLAQDCTAEDFERLQQDERKWKIHNDTQTILPPIGTVIAKIDPQWTPLWTDLFRDDARIGSLSPWGPALDNITNLPLIGYPDSVAKWDKDLLGKAVNSRADRKYAYRVRRCYNSKFGGHYNLTWIEPEDYALTWLGLSLKGHEIPSSLTMRINDVDVTPLPKSSKWNPAIVYIDHWFNVIDKKVPKPTDNKYEVIICNHNPEANNKLYLQHFIAVSLPGSRRSKRFAPNITATTTDAAITATTDKKKKKKKKKKQKL